MPRVSIIILNWNGRQDTNGCLQSLQRLRYPNYHIIVVDNGSTDGSVNFLRNLYPWITILETGRNRGFAAGNNVGLRYVCSHPADYVWLLNNDTEVAADALSNMVARAESDPRIGAVGSVLLEKSESHAVQVWGGGRVNFCLGLPKSCTERVHQEKLDYLSGASLLLRWQAVVEVGFLDERFFLYWEDTDLGFRLRAAGRKLSVAEDAFVHHRNSGSLQSQSPLWDFYFTASSVLFFSRHARFPLLPILVGTVGRLVRRALRGEWKNVHAVWRGLWHPGATSSSRFGTKSRTRS